MLHSLTRSITPLLLAVLAGCAIGEEEELQLGQEYDTQIEQQLPMITDPGILGPVERLGREIASRTSRPDLPWQFHVVDAADVNAFAVPGGYIYINRGLIERAQRMDELAGVLGHEIGHVVLRHSAEQMEDRNRTSGVVAAICVFTSLCDGGIAQVAINVAGAAWFARHSRADEAEADSAGIYAVIASGVSPEGIPSFFGTLLEERKRQPSVFDDWFSSHPLEEDRVAHTRAIIARIPAAERAGLAQDSDEFRQLKARLQQLPPAPQVTPRTAPQGQ